MAAVQAPVSPMSILALPLVEDGSSKLDLSHLSGMTLSDFITTEPKIQVVEASPSVSNRSSAPSAMHSKRSSRASNSTTKSQLRQTNSLLVDMLQNIQTELASHRTILLNIQNRVSTLEDDSNASANGGSDATLRVLEGHDVVPKLSSGLLPPPEVTNWWEACQNFARNSETPMTPREFLRTPKRVSGFDFQWARLSTPPATPPEVEQMPLPQADKIPLATPKVAEKPLPEVDDLPPLTPGSEGADSELESPLEQNVFLGEEIAQDAVDIKERTVEFDKRKLPAPPLLQPAPGAKATVVEHTVVVENIMVENDDAVVIEDAIVAVEPQIIGNPQRYFKGVRSLATYKALMKKKSDEKEHHVLIHFHRRKDMEHLKVVEA